MKNRIVTALCAVFFLAGLSFSVMAEEKKAEKKAPEVKDFMSVYMDVVKKMHKDQKGNFTPNMFMGSISPEAKAKMMQMMMSMSPIGMRDMIGMMGHKVKVQEGISFDDVIESMKTRANGVNMKLVGHNVPYKLIRQVEGYEKSPRLEILSFCDMIVMRKIVDYVPEFVNFLPCRVTVMEDAKGQIWITTLDWSVEWLKDDAGNIKFLPKDLIAGAIKVRKNLDSIMQAGAEGDF